MGKYFRCPNCSSELEKSPLDQAYGKMGGFSISGSTIELCPVCGEEIDRLSIITGKYDIKWLERLGIFKKKPRNYINETYNPEGEHTHSTSYERRVLIDDDTLDSSQKENYDDNKLDEIKRINQENWERSHKTKKE